MKEKESLFKYIIALRSHKIHYSLQIIIMQNHTTDNENERSKKIMKQTCEVQKTDINFPELECSNLSAM